MDKLAFVQKAKQKHNNKYTYENTNYVNSRTKVDITCPVHGIFQQRPADHLYGSGCKACGTQLAKTKNTKDKKYFLHNAKNTHKNLYDYSKINYKNITTPITIICKKHGKFVQKPYVHLRGAGCSLCGQKAANAKNSTNIKDFTKKAKTIHSNYYTYDKVTLRSVKDKVTITCPIHGDFQQTAYTHLKGSGCRSCASSGFNSSKPAILYYLKINNGTAYKIGITNRSINERFSITDLQKIEVIFTTFFLKGYDALNFERKILSDNKHNKYKDSFLLENGNTELFNIDILPYLKTQHKELGYEPQYTKGCF
jgi:hypothetical protein